MKIHHHTAESAGRNCLAPQRTESDKIFMRRQFLELSLRSEYDLQEEDEEDDAAQPVDEAEDDDRDAYKNVDQDNMYYFI